MIAEEREHNQFVRIAVSKIKRVRAFIHRLRLSSDYTYKDINQNLCGLAIKQNNGKKMSNYEFISYGHLEDGKITVYSYYTIAGMPMSFLTTSDVSRKLLTAIYKALPNWNVSNVEYTIDLFCADQQHVADLFYLLRKNMYFPRGKITSTKGGRLDGVDIIRTTNAVYQVNYNSKSRYIKIYERGDDKDKKVSAERKKGYWSHKDCNRVRIEFTYKRPRLKLKSPCTLQQLLSDTNMIQLLGDSQNKRIIQEINFKNFKQNRGLPSPYDTYPSKDNKGHNECFQEELIQAKKRLIISINPLKITLFLMD